MLTFFVCFKFMHEYYQPSSQQLNAMTKNWTYKYIYSSAETADIIT